MHDVRVAEQVVQVAERLLVCADQERAEVVLLAGHQLVHFERALHVALRTKRSILPSESQVRSASTALRAGRSSSRCSGMIGNNWSIAQLSGSDWKTEKLQK